MAAVPAPPPGGLRGAIDLAPLVDRQNQRVAAAARGTQPAEPPAEGASRVVIEVGDAEFPQLVELSRTVPVVIALIATWSTPSQDLVVSLRRVVEAAEGRLVLAIVDSDANPQIAAAFQVQSIPTVAAIIATQPVPLFAGVLPEERMAPLFEQVLELAAQNGVTGGVPVGDPEEAPPQEEEPAEPPLPPLHAEAYEAIDRQDYAEAARLFRTAIAQDPRDTAGVAALAQVELLDRVGQLPDDTRTRAADDPADVEAALAVADLDLSGGHVDDAFDRLLVVFVRATPEERTAVRTRLLDYFALTGVDDPRVAVARRRLASLLY